MKSILTATLASLVLTGHVFAGDAMAADGLRIESEAQFVRDYGDRIEQVSPGVYLIVDGELAGKTVSIGEAGLAYDISVQREQLASSRRTKTQTQALIRQMEGVRARYAELHAHQAADTSMRKAASGSFPCHYSSGANSVWYNGYAQVNATTELYLDTGGGGLNYYYARASAGATGFVSPPAGVPPFASVSASALAKNLYTGQTVHRTRAGVYSAGTSTGYVYSGPEFSHNLIAQASVYGIGNCFGYVSISDAMQP